MKIVNTDDIPLISMNLPIMTGPDVTLKDVSPESKVFNMAIVHFPKGVRNKFHTHTYDQVMIVTAGKGFVATEDEEREVGLNDVIWIPAGEKHWHGASKDSEFSHLFVQHRDSVTEQLED